MGWIKIQIYGKQSFKLMSSMMRNMGKWVPILLKTQIKLLVDPDPTCAAL